VIQREDIVCWLNFIILNSVAPIRDLHLISDAGAGEGLMPLHPTRDTEFIVCGQANTMLNGQCFPSPVLSNGSVTPAILVHGVFQALKTQGYKIRVHCYQLGLDSEPDFSHCMLDDVVTHYCQLGDEAAMVNEVLVPELKRQQDNGEQHLVAESGIGGTTFATLWLQRWIDNTLSFAGSTKDKTKLVKRKQVLSELNKRTSSFPMEVRAYTDSMMYSDPVQRACCALLRSRLLLINFAGGAMVFAPIVAMVNRINVEKISVATTRWVMSSADVQSVVKFLPSNCELRTPNIEFYHSQCEAIRMYEQGYVVEGCGLGACLYFAEQVGISNNALIRSLDRVVSHWL